MADVNLVVREINNLTAKMIEVGLCVDANFPSQSTERSETGPMQSVSISGVDNTSEAMKNRPYAEIYEVLCEKRAFNMRLIDGALIQFRYLFDGNGELIKHVLAFFPSPDLLEYQNEPELYDNEVLYADIVMKDIVTTPVRFDFDRKNFSDYIHPASHFTVGQYKNCRIPVLGGLTPYRFLNFILRAFYSTPYHNFCADWVGSAPDFDLTATQREKSDLHWSFAQ